MLLDASATSIVAVAGAAIGALALLTATVTAGRLSRLRRRYEVLAGDVEGGDLLSAMEGHLSQVRGLRAEVERLTGQVGEARGELADAVRHVAIVRYDAFGDMGGRLSFSAALLDDAGDGLVLTSINGRTETRTYAKGVKAGRGDATLSPEENQVVDFALHGSRTGDSGAPAKR